MRPESAWGENTIFIFEMVWGENIVFIFEMAWEEKASHIRLIVVMAIGQLTYCVLACVSQ